MRRHHSGEATLTKRPSAARLRGGDHGGIWGRVSIIREGLRWPLAFSRLYEFKITKHADLRIRAGVLKSEILLPLLLLPHCFITCCRLHQRKDLSNTDGGLHAYTLFPPSPADTMPADKTNSGFGSVSRWIGRYSRVSEYLDFQLCKSSKRSTFSARPPRSQ